MSAHCNSRVNAKDAKALLSVVCDLAILEVELVHEGLAIKEVIERLISNFKQPGAQTEKAPLQKRRDPTCETQK